MLKHNHTIYVDHSATTKPRKEVITEMLEKGITFNLGELASKPSSRKH